MKKMLSLFFVAIVLELLTYFEIVDKFFFPSVLMIVKNLGHLLIEDRLSLEIISSLYRLGLAFFISFPTSLILAFFCIHIKVVDDFINSIVAITFPLPKVALFPLLLLIFGIDDQSKIALITIGMFYLMFINFRVGFLRIMNSPYKEIIKIYPLKFHNYVIHYLLKGSLQEILTGLQVSINYGLTLIVVSEISVSNNGIGYFIWKSWDQFNILNVYSATLSLGIIGFGFYNFFNYLIDRNNKIRH